MSSTLNRSRSPYLIGSETELKPVWKDYYAAPQIPGDPKSSHTVGIWVVDARGRLAGHCDAGAGVEPSELPAALRRLLP